MAIFLDRFLLPILATVMTAVILLNPFKFDWKQRISLSICVISLAYFVSQTIAAKRLSTETIAPTILQPHPPSGDAVTSGPQSPAVSGDGNDFHYNEPAAKAPGKSKAGNGKNQ